MRVVLQALVENFDLVLVGVRTVEESRCLLPYRVIRQSLAGAAGAVKLRRFLGTPLLGRAIRPVFVSFLVTGFGLSLFDGDLD